MEIETDKATVEIEAAASGILARVSAQAGDEVPVGQTIALILTPGEAPPAQQVTPAPAPTLSRLPPAETRDEVRAKIASTPMRTMTPAPRAGRILASPKAKRIAKEQGIELSSLRGSGPEGSILAADVQRAGNGNVAQPASVAPELIPLTQMRRIVGQRMTQSKQSAPHFYISMDVDMSAVGKLRGQWKERGDGSVPSLNDFILQATAHALKEFPSMNSSFTEQGIQQHSDINIGVAVALDEGLVVPVIRNADRLSLQNWPSKATISPTRRKVKNSFRSTTRAVLLPCRILACSVSIASPPSSTRRNRRF